MFRKILFFQPAIIQPNKIIYGTIANGLIALGLYLEMEGFNVSIAHFYNSMFSIKKTVTNYLNSLNPDVVGINLTWHTHLYQSIEIAKIVKRRKRNLPVIVGGSTASYFDKDIYKYLWSTDPAYYPQFDFIVRGDGELPFYEYLNKNVIPKYNTTIPNELGTSERYSIKYIQDYLPNVHFKSTINNFILDINNYLARNGSRTSVPGLEEPIGHNISNREIDIYLGKGCPNNCCYCGGSNKSHKIISCRDNYIFRNIDDVICDIYYLKELGIERIYFNFDPDPQRKFYENLFSRLEPIGIDLMFSAWSGPIKNMHLDMMKTIFKNIEIVISPESGSERLRKLLIFKNYGKKPFYSNRRLLEFFKELKDRNIKSMCHFITGLPFEHKDDIVETQKLLNNIYNNYREIFIKSYDSNLKRNLCSPPLYLEPCSQIQCQPETFKMHLNRLSFEDFIVNSKNPYKKPLLGVYSDIYRNEDEVMKKAFNFIAV